MKINYNRWKISAKEIQMHQDFNKIIKKIQTESTPYWKSIGFWGRVGISCAFLVLLIYPF